MRQYMEWGQSAIENYADLLTAAKEYLPNLIGALVVLILGWLCATLARFIILKLGAAVDSMIISVGHSLGIKHINPHKAIPSIIGNTIYWIIILFTLGTILRAMGWPGLLLLLHDYFPRLFGSLFIILTGYLVSNFIGYLINHYDGIKNEQYASTLERVSKIIIIIFAILMALEYLGFNMMLFNYLFLMIILFVLLSASLAFGIGARHTISHLLAMRNVRQYYQMGQMVTVAGITGQVIDIKPHVIVLQTTDGKAIVPGNIFYENVTTLIEPEKHA